MYICWHSIYLQDPGLAIVRLSSSEDMLDSQSDYQKKGVFHLPRCDTLVQELEQSSRPGGLSIFENKGVMILVVFDNRQYVILELRQIREVGGTGHCGLRHCVW